MVTSQNQQLKNDLVMHLESDFSTVLLSPGRQAISRCPSNRFVFCYLGEKREIIRNNHELHQDFSLRFWQAPACSSEKALSTSGVCGASESEGYGKAHEDHD